MKIAFPDARMVAPASYLRFHTRGHKPEASDDPETSTIEVDVSAFAGGVPPLRIARHGASEEKNGAAKHQRIAQVVESIVETGTVHYRDRHIDDQQDKQYGRARPRGCCPGFLADKQ